MPSFFVGYGKEAERFKGVRYGYLPDLDPEVEPPPTIESMDDIVQKMNALIKGQAELKNQKPVYVPPTKPNNEAF